MINRILDELGGDPDINVLWIASHRSGNAIAKVWQAVAGYVVAFLRMPFADLVHIHSSAEVSFFRKSAFYWLARLWRRPVIWHLHSPNTDFERFYSRRDAAGRYARYVLGSCRHIVVLSDSWISLAENILPRDKLRVIYNPIPRVVPDEESIPREPGRILYLAHLIQRKGFPLLIKAFANVAEEFPQARLVFAGSGELKEAKALCDELGIRSRVDFLGWIGEPQRTHELRRAGIFALPSYQEGLPMGVLEALAFGLAVVATPVGGIGDVVEDGRNGLLVKPGDDQQLAVALRSLLAEPALASRLATEGQRSVAQFSPGALAGEWKALYLETINEVETVEAL